MHETESLIPARMVNEFTYCPRLFWLEHVERDFTASYDTVDGDRIHRRVDRAKGELPDDLTAFRSEITSVELASQALGVVAKIDLLKPEGQSVVPVDYKRGSRPAIPHGAYQPERIQIALQVLLLRERGLPASLGRIYYARSKEHVDVVVDANLEADARSAIAGARALAASTSIPPPLRNSPKCGRCSLHAICLPDETIALQTGAGEVRPFAAQLVDGVSVYVTEPGSRIGIRREVLEVRTDDGVQGEARLLEIENVSLFGNVQISSQALRALLAREIPTMFLSYGGWINGVARAPSAKPRLAHHTACGCTKRRRRACHRAIDRRWKGTQSAHVDPTWIA